LVKNSCFNNIYFNENATLDTLFVKNEEFSESGISISRIYVCDSTALTLFHHSKNTQKTHNTMKKQKLSVVQKQDSTFDYRLGKLFSDIVQEIHAAKRSGNWEMERCYDSLARGILDAIKKDDYALFEEVENDFVFAQYK